MPARATPERRRAKKADLLRRVNAPSDDALRHCAIPGCGRAPEARQGNGLSPTLCRYHRAHRSRHGSPMKRSYTGPELKPYIAAAQSHLKACRNEFYTAHAIRAVAEMLATAGPVHRVVDLPLMAPDRKARDTLARLRERGVPPERIVAVHAGVLAAIAEDPFGPGSDRATFARVQTAKALRRRAGGYHAYYGVPGGKGYHRYPRSSGRVLVALGAMVEQACELFIDRHLAAILALKIERYGPRPPAGFELPPVARSRFGNERVPPPPPPPATEPAQGGAAPDDPEARDAERLVQELRADVRKRGIRAFTGRRL